MQLIHFLFIIWADYNEVTHIVIKGSLCNSDEAGYIQVFTLTKTIRLFEDY